MKAESDTRDAPASGDAEADGPRESSWLLGWVIGPGIIVLGILTAGAYVGANHSDSWVTRLVNWAVALF